MVWLLIGSDRLQIIAYTSTFILFLANYLSYFLKNLTIKVLSIP